MKARACAIRTVLLAAWLSVASTAAAQGGGNRVARLVGGFEAKYGAVVGLSVVSLPRGRTMAVHRAQTPLIPASNQKLLTSAFALDRLGPAFHFRTSLYVHGEHLVVTGDFDPTLGDSVLAERFDESIYGELDRWALAVRRRVGDTIPGDLVLASKTMGHPLRHRDWPENQFRRDYAAPVSDLNFHGNCWWVAFRVEGQTVAPVITPESRLFRVVSHVRPGRRHVWSLTPGEDDALLTLRGTAKAGAISSYPVAVDRPRLLLGRVLYDRLARAGVTIRGQVRIAAADEVPRDERKLLARRVTPIWPALEMANTRSINLAGECLLLRAAEAPWPEAALAMTRALCERYDIAPEQLTVRDGSGLSAGNRVSASAMTKMLAALARADHAERFVKTLAQSGRDGTLRRRLAEVPYRGRIAAKSGYVAGVRALSGYVLSDQGQPVAAFAVLVNRVKSGKGWQAKAMIDDVCRTLVDRQRTPGR